MGSATSCSSIETQDISLMRHSNSQRIAVLSDKRNSFNEGQQCRDSSESAPGTSNKSPEAESRSGDLEEVQRLNCSWCESQFESARRNAAGPAQVPITESETEGEKDGTEGHSTVSEAERNASRNNLLIPSRLAGSAWNGFEFLREEVSDICNLSESLLHGNEEFLRSPDGIDQRSVSCNFPEESTVYLNQKTEGMIDDGPIVKESTELHDTRDSEGGSGSNSLCSVSQSIIEKNEDAASCGEASLLVNLRSESICSEQRSECDDDNISLPEEDYHVVDEVELNKYEVLGNVKNSENWPQTEWCVDKEERDTHSDNQSSTRQDASWDQLDGEMVMLMDLLERLSHILVEKAKRLVGRRTQSRSPHPLRGLRACGASVQRVEHRKRVIIVQDGESQFRIRGKLSCL